MGFVSHACMYPAETQAVIGPEPQGRRHPYEGYRPKFSGYCVIDICACECHQERVCANCGGPLNAARAGKIYCSDACRYAARKAGTLSGVAGLCVNA
jgi:hypothetical protein